MSAQHQKAAVVATVADLLGLSHSSVTPDSEFALLGADSLDMVEITIAIEDDFKILIADEDMDQVKTVGDLCAIVDRMTGAA